MDKRRNLRMLAVLLALLTGLIACQPTPEEEPVANKGDRVLEEKIAAPAPTQQVGDKGEEAEAPAPTVYQYTFPDRWEEVYETGTELVLTFDADIIQKADGVYPVYRTRTGNMDIETVQKAAEALLAAPLSVHDTGMTKDDWKQDMERYLKDMEEHQARLRLPPEERGDGDDTPITQEEIDAQLKWYTEQMAAAPDTLEEVEATDFSGIHVGGEQAYRLSDGDTACITVGKTYWIIRRSVSKGGYVAAAYERRDYEDSGLVWKDVTMSQETAVALGQETMDKLGLEGFSMLEVYEANYIGDAGMKSPLSAGYTMRFKRDFGGYPLVTSVEPAQYFQYGEGEDYAANSHIGEEYIDIYVDEMGVRYIDYSNPKEVLREENASVELLPFETIQERIRKSLTYGLTGIEKQAEVYQIVLTVNTQRVVNSDEFYEVPCWVVFYDTMRYSSFTPPEQMEEVKARVRAPHFVMQQALYINAIDGTVFHIDYGY